MKKVILGCLVLAGLAYGSVVMQPVLWLLSNKNELEVRGDAFWKKQYLQRTAWPWAEFHEFIQHDLHPTLGWVPKPFYTPETTNARGHRSTVEYCYQPDKFTIAIYGDSFTAGSGAPDNEVWPALLQQRDARLHVLNLAVGGYGLDQMYLKMKEEVAEYKPQLIIFAPISDDFHRSLLSMREYVKPRLVLSADGALTLTNTPISPMEETIDRLWNQYGFFSAQEKLLQENEAALKHIESGGYAREWRTLNKAILRDAAVIAASVPAELMLLYVASGIEIGGTPLVDADCFEEDLLQEAAKEKGAVFVPTRRKFAEQSGKWTWGHYTLAEAQFLVDIVYESLEQVEGWRAYKAGNPAGE